MGRRRKVVKQPRKADGSDYDSDDERAYKKLPAPDPDAPDYFMDEVDEFNENKDKILLEGDNKEDEDSDSEDQEDLFSLDYSDSDDGTIEKHLRTFKMQQHLEEIASDVEDEGQESKSGIPDAKAWGKKKKEFYHTDYVDDDLPGVSGSEEEEAQDEEEREALAIQQRMSQMMQETDFDLQLFQESKTLEKKTLEFEDKTEERVIKDLSKLSKRDKLAILKKESPEFEELVEDFKAKVRTLIKLFPLRDMVEDGRIPQGLGADYIYTRCKLYINYCINISFYISLKAKHVPVHNHPVIGVILEHKKLMKQLEPLDQQLEAEIEELLAITQQDPCIENANQSPGSPMQTSDEDSSEDDNEETENVKSNIKTKDVKRNSKKMSSRKSVPATEAVEMDSSRKEQSLKTQDRRLTTDEQKALEYYDKMAKEIEERKLERRRQQKELDGKVQFDEVQQEEEMEDGKRAITYQISKNKGLTPHRKKEQRNPRVKNKMKFKKAKVRRKGQVREVRKELVRYGGEASGVRAGVIKSIKIK
ncbi:something about silencing protein 10-like [Asterias amurensis]|uniref:something about silencing protein 10-like n=1 Tax=Asterias amurensis TaxID=7602 RepID=UPI003AB1CB35